MEHENRWKRLGQTELNSLLMRNAGKCVLYSVHRIVLLESFDIGHQDVCMGEMESGETDLDIELE
jgi:hypothetical protein